jgi:hypothetical protein
VTAEEKDESSSLPPVLPVSAVTDEERNRYGLLVDRAAERGLIDPDDYEVRLRDLAAASTLEQMNRIVTELPVFAPAPATRSSPRASGPSFPGGPLPMGASRRRSSPWLLLLIVVAVVAASLVFLTISAEHTVRNRNSGLAPSVTATRTLSALRL